VSGTFRGLNVLIAESFHCSASTTVAVTFDGQVMKEHLTLAEEDIDPGDHVEFQWELNFSPQTQEEIHKSTR
jgi:hypothetical protein